MTSPSAILLNAELGRSFLLNFDFCWPHLFTDQNEVCARLGEWWRVTEMNFAAVPAEFTLSTLFSKFNDRAWGKKTINMPTGLSRIAKLSTFYSPPHSDDDAYSLLDPVLAKRYYGLCSRDIIDGTIIEKLELCNGDATIIRAGARLRGRAQLSWVTDVRNFQYPHTSLPPVPSPSYAHRICRSLGIDGNIYLNQPLFRLDFPETLMSTLKTAEQVSRPTALEGINNRYFRARNDDPDDKSPSKTVDLERFERGDSNIDGADEYILPEVDFTSDFTWAGIGFLETNCNPSATVLPDSALSCHPDSITLTSAQELFDMLCTTGVV